MLTGEKEKSYEETKHTWFCAVSLSSRKAEAWSVVISSDISSEKFYLLKKGKWRVVSFKASGSSDRVSLTS